MMKKKRYMNLFRNRSFLLEDALLILGATAVGFILLVVLVGCQRRELYVYGDEFRSVELEVDWRNYVDRDPDGMTVWFYSLDDLSKSPYRTTTANVRHHDLYLPGGYYQGVVVDYSPEEFSRQAFLNMERVDSARVEATPATYQPDSLTVSGEGVPSGVNDEVNWQLYGEPAWTDLQYPRPAVSEESGLYVVANQPEDMALDTLNNRYVDRGEYGDYIPWRERDYYQSTIKMTKIYSEPLPIIWKLRIRVWIKGGFNYLWQTPSAISGLADGHFLPRDVITDNPCLLNISNWELERTGENSGYISTTMNVFGLRPETVLDTREWRNGTDVSERIYYYTRGGGQQGQSRAGDTEPDYGDPTWWEHYVKNSLPKDVRLGLSFVLRDHATVKTWHFNVGHYIVSYDNQLVLRLELGPEFFDPNNPHGAHGDGGDPDNPSPDIILPYVDAYNGAGFGAEVTPWQEMPPVEINF